MPNFDVVQTLAAFLILLASLTVHEAAHAWSADRLGDSTARMLGRRSLNPLVHIDLIGTIVFPLIALATNLPLIGWAKPVPVNTAELRPHWRQKFMVIAAAGPASNLVLAAGAAIVLRVVSPDLFDPTVSVPLDPVSSALQTAVELNVLLAVFNMIPVPPLDGGNVLSGLLTGTMADAFDRVRPFGFLILYALMFTNVLWAIVAPPARFLLSWLL